MPLALEGKRLGLRVFGCRTNQYEGEALASAFVLAGACAEEEAPWDVVLVVSCAVTGEAERKCRQSLRRLRRESPDALIVLCGCFGQMIDEEASRRLGVDLLVGNGLKHRILDLVTAALSDRATGPAAVREDVWRERSWDALHLRSLQRHTRAFLKVQDGCDHFCTYCIVPSLRGRPVSRSVEEVLAEARELAASGVREFVLTGVHLGLFGRDSGESLGALVQRLAALPGVTRIRFGSLEPFAVDDNLLARLGDTPQFCPHFHLPLQSGDDGVLAAMHRGYTSAQFAAVVGAIRRRFGDDVHIGTDILAGFPGEDDAAFQRTLALARELEMGRLHVFPFSPREGTPAASFAGRVSPAQASERCRRGVELSAELLSRFARRFVGRRLDLLVEQSGSGRCEGFSPHYIRVVAPGEAVPGEERKVLILDEQAGDLAGGTC